MDSDILKQMVELEKAKVKRINDLLGERAILDAKTAERLKDIAAELKALGWRKPTEEDGEERDRMKASGRDWPEALTNARKLKS